ncbi:MULTISPECIES: DUF4250 domain-containing protein [Fusobacterium]|uniref:DUF4250 domain-containing protein n=1 Tax=Fusobacterium TaxID=848 RepID=UPI001476DE6F|nr:MULTISPECIES: DUF4250 domain-containing protein [Fusobacterium]NME35605.1 DUF4250 domain-containing protein [Fusobacterium sp. FSA-380-WT-3A]
MNFIKMDINIAYSMINMKLRDFYSSLDSLCEDMDIDKNELIEHFEKNGYFYDENKNQFSLK